MKHLIKSLLLVATLLALPLTFTSCEDILGEWSKPTPATTTVSVTGISLNQTTLSMKVGDADVTLTATVTPDNATTVTWISDKESVATVTDGVVHAVAEGTATITAKAGDQTATCTVTVTVPYTAKEYKKASWNGTLEKVEFTRMSAATDPTAVTNSGTGVTWGDGWYTVSGDVTITGNVTLGADTHLILCDGAKLTINGQIDGSNNKNLYIYGQEEGTGKLVVTNSTYAIYGTANPGYTIEIHGGVITATSTSAAGLYYYGITMYGGKLNATGFNGIGFAPGNFDLYGGEVVAEGTVTGIYSVSGLDILTVYGGKVQATGGTGYPAIGTKIKSGTSDIKFYFSTDGTDWDSGTYKGSAVAADNKRYAKAE